METATKFVDRDNSPLRANGRVELTCGSIATAVVAAAVWRDSGSLIPLAWLIAAQLVYGTRFWLMRKSALSNASTSKDSFGNTFAVSATGLLWGGAAATCLLQFGMTWVTGVVSATAVILAILVLGCYLGSRKVVIPFAVATAVPIGLVGLLALEPATVVVGISSLLFMAVISISAKYIEQLVRHSRGLETQGEEYRSMLKISEQDVMRLEIGVKTNKEKRRALEEELNHASSGLIISEGKAEALASALDRVTPHDTQTGLLNAKKFGNVIEREWARMVRQEQPISLVQMTIDDFDDYKKNYGNIAYEAAIRRVAELTRRIGTRPGDVVARISENKFSLLFPEADSKNGEILAGVLREKIRRLNMPNHDSAMHSAVTASFGVATVITNSDLTIEELTKRADAGLYEAQFQGGDKVVRYRIMNNIKLERWDRAQEGDLTPDGLIRKLSVLGYETMPKTYKPGEYSADQRIQIDTIDAIVQGSLKVSLDGESTILKPGDCLFIPKGLVSSAEVVGDKSVICLTGTRV